MLNRENEQNGSQAKKVVPNGRVSTPEQTHNHPSCDLPIQEPQDKDCPSMHDTADNTAAGRFAQAILAAVKEYERECLGHYVHVTAPLQDKTALSIHGSQKGEAGVDYGN